ncbi:MAG TPA: ABC transporter permease [Gaiellales bacterium]|nr:ABC transporter permease [Gaiellales bacterium]
MSALDEPGLAADTADAGVDVRRVRRQRRAELISAALHSKTFVVGMAIVVFWLFSALTWRWVVTNPQAVDPGATLASPSADHWFGTDNLGRDVFARVIAGAAPVLTIAPLATLLGLFGGITVGLVTGYYRGWTDDVFSRVVDALLAFPLIIMAVLVLASLGRSPRNVILVIGIIFTPLIARTVRSAVLVEREGEYVAAARLRGERGPRIMVVEILPNITAPILVEGTIRLGYAIFAASTLAFLGLGIQDPSPDWGLAIANGQAYLQVAWWMVVFPAAALATLVVGVNLIADGLRRAIEE